MNIVLEAIFPMIANWRVNKILRKKLSDNNLDGETNGLGSILSQINNAEAIKTDILKEQYIDALNIKEKLEDKAKTNIVGITIAITLIMGGSGVLKTVAERYATPVLTWISFALFSIGVIYMLTAGIIAIKVLIHENKIYTVSLNSFASGEILLRSDYDKCISQNQTQNLIRNNSVFTSYECIRNAMICLFLILILSSIPIKNNLIGENIIGYSGPVQYSFMFSSSSVTYLRSNNIQLDVENAIINAIQNGTLTGNSNNIFSIIENGKNIFIKFRVDREVITVLLIEPYIVP